MGSTVNFFFWENVCGNLIRIQNYRPPGQWLLPSGHLVEREEQGLKGFFQEKKPDGEVILCRELRQNST